jgi:sodium pump decarboxylase gamma subunit
MGTALLNALLITLIGMGLVFLAILMLWGIMEAMARLTARSAAKESAEDEAAQPVESVSQPALKASVDSHRKAAAAAVAVALAAEKARAALRNAARPRPSAWRAVAQAGQLNQRTGLFERKSGGKK